MYIIYIYNNRILLSYCSSTSSPVLFVFHSAPRLVVKALGTARWCVWMRTKEARFTLGTATWASGLQTARAVVYNPASMSGSQENGRRYVLGLLFLPSGQQWPEGNRKMKAGMRETGTHLPVLPLRTVSSRARRWAFLGQSPTCANWGRCMRWSLSSL